MAVSTLKGEQARREGERKKSINTENGVAGMDVLQCVRKGQQICSLQGVCKEDTSRRNATKNFNTTNLIRHLKVSHIEEYIELSKLATAKAEKEKERAATQAPLTQLTSTQTYLNDSNPTATTARKRKN